MSMLEVKDLHVSYGAIKAVQGISFEMEQGETVALIGSNGAGHRGASLNGAFRRFASGRWLDGL